MLYQMNNTFFDFILIYLFNCLRFCCNFFQISVPISIVENCIVCLFCFGMCQTQSKIIVVAVSIRVKRICYQFPLFSPNCELVQIILLYIPIAGSMHRCLRLHSSIHSERQWIFDDTHTHKSKYLCGMFYTISLERQWFRFHLNRHTHTLDFIEYKVCIV